MASNSMSNSTNLESLDFECEDETGTCGPCQPGFTGTQCDQCIPDFESVDFPGNPGVPNGQLVNCMKCKDKLHILRVLVKQNIPFTFSLS